MSDDTPLRTDGGDEEEEPVTDPFAELGDGVDDPASEDRERPDAHVEGDPFGDDTEDDPFGDDTEDHPFGDDENSGTLFSDDPTADDPISDDPPSGEPSSADAVSNARTSDDAVSADRASDDDPFDQLGPAVDADAADLDDAFEQMDVSGPAAEDVWESLDEDASGTGASVDSAGARESPASPGGAEPGEEGVERLVNKRTYCQQCPYFSAPPDVACGHEGTTIVEAVGFDEFRVRNCPMVSEDDPTFDADG